MRTLGDSLAGTIRDIQEKQQDFSVTPIPYIGDWYTFAEVFEYVTVFTGSGFRYGRIKFSDTNLSHADFFAVGDRLRYKQNSGAYKYAYVTNITTAYLEIFGGEDYILENQTITELGRGLTATPVGHPIVFKFDPQISALGATYTQAGSPDYTFYMIGKVVSVRLYELNGSSVNGSSFLKFVLPVKADEIYDSFVTLLNGTPSVGHCYVNNGLFDPTDPENYGWVTKDVADNVIVSGTVNHLGTITYPALIT